MVVMLSSRDLEKVITGRNTNVVMMPHGLLSLASHGACSGNLG
jgi:hypothetical protein